MQLKVIVPCYNAYPWLERSLASIAEQREVDFSVCVVDDASTNPKVGEVVSRCADQPNWIIFREEENRGSLGSIARGMELLEPADDDVICVVDGDDWLAHDEVFQRIFALYENEPVDATYGQHIDYPSGGRGYCFGYTHEQLYRREIRSLWTGFGHLRTFRAFLWKAIKQRDLVDVEGNFLREATDWAHYAPILEMAGERARFVEEPLYVYNRSNPINEFRISLTEQMSSSLLHRCRPPYARHPRCMRQTLGLGKEGRWQDRPTLFHIKVVGGVDERTEASIREQTYPHVVRYDGSAKEQEVIVEIQAGDWFLRTDALEYIADQYATGEIDATFGDAVHFPGNRRGALTPYSFAELREGDLSHPSRGAAPPYTYRAGLWEGDFLTLLRRVRHRACFLDTPLYAVNTLRQTPATT